MEFVESEEGPIPDSRSHRMRQRFIGAGSGCLDNGKRAMRHELDRLHEGFFQGQRWSYCTSTRSVFRAKSSGASVKQLRTSASLP